MSRRYFPLKPWRVTPRVTLGRAATLTAARAWQYSGAAFDAMRDLAALLRGAARAV